MFEGRKETRCTNVVELSDRHALRIPFLPVYWNKVHYNYEYEINKIILCLISQQKSYEHNGWRGGLFSSMVVPNGTDQIILLALTLSEPNPAIKTH
jgi:hypothetical protein